MKLLSYKLFTALLGLIELMDSIEFCYNNLEDSSVFNVSSYLLSFCKLECVNILFSLKIVTPFYDVGVFFLNNFWTGLYNM